MKVKNLDLPRSAEDIRLLQEIWALIVSAGRLTHRNFNTWGYYSGGFTPDQYEIARQLSENLPPEQKVTPYGQEVKKYIKDAEKEIVSYPQKILKIGIDWQKTLHPDYIEMSEFAGTGDPADSVPIWRGILVLKDGTEVRAYAKAKHVDGVKSRVDRLVYNKRTAEQNIDELIQRHFG